MVVEKTLSGRRVFACGECGLAYAERKTAEKCQAWCSKHKSCNLEIIRHAVRQPKQKA